MDEAAFRALLDDGGILREPLTPPDPSQAYLIFAQRPDARLEIAQLNQHAERFFGTTLALSIPKKYVAGYPDTDATLLTLAPTTVAGGTRLVYGRPRSERDLDAAQQAEMRAGYTGMFDLARRCETVWLVARESEDDRTSLLCAAIFASVMLGPILHNGELFGVRTARTKLDEGAQSYRR